MVLSKYSMPTVTVTVSLIFKNVLSQIFQIRQKNVNEEQSLRARTITSMTTTGCCKYPSLFHILLFDQNIEWCWTVPPKNPSRRSLFNLLTVLPIIFSLPWTLTTIVSIVIDRFFERFDLSRRRSSPSLVNGFPK